MKTGKRIGAGSAWISVRGAKPRRISTREMQAVRPISDEAMVQAIMDSPFEVAMRQAMADNAKLGLK